MKLHLLQKEPGLASVRLRNHPAGQYVYEIGTYVMSEETAQGLKGALLCLHKTKATPLQLGGRMIDIKIDQPREKGAIQSGVVFIYIYDPKAKNVAADLERWKRQDW
jgi:hypothetical protein